MASRPPAAAPAPVPLVANGCRRDSMVRRAMKEGLPRSNAPRVLERRREAHSMLYAGLDLSRKRLDLRLLDAAGETVELVRRRRTPMVCTVWPFVLAVMVMPSMPRSSR